MLTNSASTYGTLTKFFHWLTALLVLTLIPLGIYANALPYDTSLELSHKARMFSLHKTLGIFVFFVALLRIIWAATQIKPKLLNADKPLESTLAELIHWSLYGALVLVPLTGWISHGASTGFAPIWWPLGQNLPLVPKDAEIAHLFAALHIIFERVLAISILLHVAGALKHHFIDRDATLRRMWPGLNLPPEAGTPSAATAPPQHRKFLPIAGALGGYCLALLIGTGLGMFGPAPNHKTAATAQHQTTQEAQGNWQVESGKLGLTVRQMGSDVSGQFEDWRAVIQFSEIPDSAGHHGTVTVDIPIGSLSLGGITQQALGEDFFNAASFPNARFQADLLADAAAGDGAYVAQGNLTLRGVTAPVSLPFTLTLDGDKARMRGETELSRKDFKIGETYPDESNVGFTVRISVELTAKRKD